MKSTRTRRKAALLTLLAAGLLSGPASAEQYSVLLDADDDAGTGCSLTLPGSGVTLDGIESRLTATTNASQQVTGVTRETCASGVFGAPTTVGGGYPVGLDNGVSGTDVVELADGLAGLGASRGGTARLAFAARDAGGDDALATAGGGGPIVISLPALSTQAIPGLGVAGAALLILFLGGIALVALRRRPGAAWTVVGLLVLGTAWASHLVTDGQVDDWFSASPIATDAGGDASNGNPAIDILAAFVEIENGRLYARIDVSDVENAAPAADATSATVVEDGGPVTVSLSGSDPEGDALSFAIATPPGQGSLGTINPTGATTATVDYTPDPDAFGADSFTYTASDGPGVSTPATASITVTPVNDPPDAVDDSVTVDEDSVNNSLDVLANDTDAPDAGETLTITGVGATDQGGTATTGGASISYTPAADFAGTETFTYTIGDGNGGSDTATVTVTVSDVNDAPTITAIADQSIPEDGATGSLAFTVDDTESAATALTVTATSSNQVLLPDANLTLGGTGANRTIEAAPAANQNGTANVTVTVQDPDGGSGSTSFQLTVTSENDAPTISAVANQSILEDTTTGPLAFTVDDVETAAGSLTVSAASGNTAVIPDANLVLGGTGANRTITVTPAADAFGGPVTITVTVQDTDGGSTPGSFDVTVNAVNDAPSFGLAGNVASDEDAGPQSVANQATGISAGPGEGGQTVSFQVTNDNNALFSSQPAVDPAGTLSYTAAANANGSALVTVTAMDDGGTPNGGTDTSGPQTFTITVNAVNDPPQVTAPGPFSVTGNVRIQVTDGADDLLAGANDAADGGTALSVTTGSIASTQGGNVTLNADGTFDYDPPAGYEGADSFSFEVCDSGVPGSACTNATVNVNVSDMVWFVDASASAGDGRLNSPFNDVDALDAVNDGTGNHPAAGDDIFLYTGTHDGSLALLNTQRVFGQGASAALATLTGITLSAYSDPFPATGGTRPNWTATNATALTVAQNNSLRGFNIGDTGTGTDVAGNNFGTLTISELDLLGTGQALDLDTGTLAGTIGAITSTSGSRNLSLVGVAGTPTLGTGSLSGAANQAFLVDGGTGTFSYPGSISNTTNRVAQIQNKTGGDVTLSGNLTSNSGGTGILVSGNSGGLYAFSGGSKTLNTGANPAVTLSSNTGATINFSNGGLDIDTTTGAGFSATGGGIVSVTGAGNTIDSTGATALSVQSTTIGGAGLLFQRLSSSGASSGILLDGTGAGGLTVSGLDGADAGTDPDIGSGGTIQNTGSHGISLTNARNVVLQGMIVDTTAGHGIFGTGLSAATPGSNGNAFTFAHGDIRGTGDANGEAGIHFGTASQNNLRDSATIDSVVFDNYFENGLHVENSTVNADITIADTIFQNADDTANSQAVLLNTTQAGNAGIDLTVSGSTFGMPVGAATPTICCTGITFNAQGSGSHSLTVMESRFENMSRSGSGQGISAVTAQTAAMTVNVSNNSDGAGDGFVDLEAAHIGLAPVDNSTMTGQISNNTFTGPNRAGVPISIVGDGGDGTLASTFTGIFAIDGNTISGQDFGLNLISRDTTTPTGRMDFTITNNTIATAGNGQESIWLNSLDSAGFCADVRDNLITTGGVFDDIGIAEQNTSALNIVQASAAGLSANNNGASVGVLAGAPTYSAVCATP